MKIIIYILVQAWVTLTSMGRKLKHRPPPPPPPPSKEEKLLEEILEVEERELHTLERIEHDLRHPPNHQRLTASIANVFSGDCTMSNNALVFNVGQTSIDTITPFLADGVTPSGGVVSNVSVTFSDPSATAVVQPDNTILFTGVADSGGAAVGGSTSATVTDTDGVVSTWTTAFTVQTIGVAPPPPAQLTQSVINVFSDPV